MSQTMNLPPGLLAQLAMRDAGRPQPNGLLSQDETAEARATRLGPPRQSISDSYFRRIGRSRGQSPTVRGNFPGASFGPVAQHILQAKSEGTGEYTDSGQDVPVGSQQTEAYQEQTNPAYHWNSATKKYEQPQQPQSPSNLAVGGMLGVNPATLQSPGSDTPRAQHFQVTSDLNAPNPFPQAATPQQPQGGGGQPYQMQIQRGTGPTAQTENWDFQHGQAPVTTQASGQDALLDSLKGRVGDPDLAYLKAYGSQPGVTPQHMNEAIHQALSRNAEQTRFETTQKTARTKSLTELHEQLGESVHDSQDYLDYPPDPNAPEFKGNQKAFAEATQRRQAQVGMMEQIKRLQAMDQGADTATNQVEDQGSSPQNQGWTHPQTGNQFQEGDIIHSPSTGKIWKVINGQPVEQTSG